MTRVNAVRLSGITIVSVIAVYFVMDYMVLDSRIRAFTAPASTDGPNFVDRTSEFGIVVSHRQGDEQITGLDESLGAGACAVDYDNDGWMDLFIVNGSGDTRYYGRPHWWQPSKGYRLLRNVGGHYFEDVTDKANVGAIAQGMGCVAADFDNDGNTDLLITNKGANILFRNNGNGTFTDVTRESGLAGDGWHTAAAVADVDGDGLLDVYIGRFISFEKGSHTYEPNSQYKQDTSPFFNSALYPAQANLLYRNVGGLRFADVTEIAGVADAEGRTLAAIWVDVNGDRKPDLIVANAAGTGSTTGFINRGNWHFDPMGIQARIESGLSYRGIAIGDLNNSGNVDLLLTGASGSQTALLSLEAVTAKGEPNFVDKARPWQIASEKYAAFSPWSPALADFNNDGWTDLFVVNGQIAPDADSKHVTIGQPKQLWLNGGDSRLHEYKVPALSPLLDRQSARGLVVADFNNDGRLDIYVAHNNDLGQLLLNTQHSPGHWLGVRLIDKYGNSDAVGAHVAVTTDQGTQVKRATKGQGFLSDSDPRLHFGLGSRSRASIAVQWADGSKNTYRNVEADAYVTLSRKKGIKIAKTAAPIAPAKPVKEPSNDVPETRVEYFRALAAAEISAGVAARLRAALADPSDDVRAGLVAVLAKARSAESLRLLLRFLEDSSEIVVVGTVDAICPFEEETTIRHLLRMFAHSSAAVRRHTADCFTAYYQAFQEQQAVIHRKYLAVPYLAALLSDSDVAVRIAAAKALGAAEKFRGEQPLIEALKDPDLRLKNEAVRALGLIRDRYALNALVSLLAEPNLASTTYSRIFIALKRLDYPALDKTLVEFANGRGKFSNAKFEIRLGALVDILESDEGVVLSRERILSLANAAYAASSRSDAGAILYTRLAEKSGSAKGAAAIASLCNHVNPQVRSAAYLARFTLDPTNRVALINAALRDPDISVRVTILQRIAKEQVRLPDTMLLDAMQHDGTRLAALNALRGVTSDAVIKLLSAWVADDSEKKEVRLASLAALGLSNHVWTPADNWYQNADDELRIALLKYEAQALPAIYVSKAPPPFLQRYLNTKSAAVRRASYDFLLTREELWAKQAVVGLLQNGGDSPLRHHVLQALPLDYFRDGALFLKIASSSDDPLRFEALRRLHGATDAHTIQGLLAIARDTKVDEKTRVLASVALPPNLGKEILSNLVGGGGT